MKIPPPPTPAEISAAKTRLFGNVGNDFLPGNYAIKFYRNDFPLYFAKNFSFPPMRMTAIPVYTNTGKDYKVPGEKIDYDDITITYRLDEYAEVWNWHSDWMKNISHYDYQFNPFDSINDISVTLLTNKQNPFQTFHFSGIIPVEIGPMEFDPTESQSVLSFTVRYAFHDLYTHKHLP